MRSFTSAFAFTITFTVAFTFTFTRTAHADAVIHAADVKPLPIAAGKGSAKLLLDGRGASVALDLLSAQAGAKVPAHKHEGSDEIIYVISGKGSTTVGGVTSSIGVGDVVHIPRGVEHSLAVTEDLTAVQVYSPPGPEQRFKQK